MNRNFSREDVQCFNSISESFSEINEQRIFHENRPLLQSTEKCSLERDLTSHLQFERGPVPRRCEFKSRSSQHFLVDFGSVRLSCKNFYANNIHEESNSVPKSAIQCKLLYYLSSVLCFFEITLLLSN